MDQNELLGQIAQMMEAQEKRLDAKLEAQEKRLDAKLEAQEKRIISQIKAVIETEVTPKIQLIAEQHGEIISRLPQADEQAELKSRVRVLEQVTAGLRSDVDDMKQAQ